jgi:D-apiose dehydrogenase
MNMAISTTALQPVRVGLIGCGFYAQNHLNSWRDLASDGARLVAVCDRDEAKARAAGEKFGAQWFTDARLMLDTV